MRDEDEVDGDMDGYGPPMEEKQALGNGKYEEGDREGEKASGYIVQVVRRFYGYEKHGSGGTK